MNMIFDKKVTDDQILTKTITDYRFLTRNELIMDARQKTTKIDLRQKVADDQ